MAPSGDEVFVKVRDVLSDALGVDDEELTIGYGANQMTRGKGL